MPMSKVLKGGTVVTFDEESQTVKVLPKASILIKAGRIDDIKPIFEDLHIPEGASILDVGGKIVSPGFVNTHVHMWMTLFRTIAPDVVLSHYFDWLSQNSKTASTAITPDDVYISCLEGYLEGLNGGVTSYVDHAHNNWELSATESSFKAIIDSGARSWWCYDPADRAGFSLEEQWNEYERIATKTPRPSTAAIGLSYDGSVGSEGEKFDEIKRRVKDLNIEAITIHHLGGPWPTGKSSPSDFVQQGVTNLGIPVILSHAPFLTDGDMQHLRDQNMHISITPESEFHYGHGQDTGHLISDQASLGVDTNFTFSGDMITQARMWLQKVRLRGFSTFLEESGLLPANTPMSVEQAFLLATRQGGKALWRDDIGVLKVGARADIVVFNGDSPNMLGWSNAVAAIMLHANVGDIEHVLVDGEFRKRDFQLVNMKHDWAVVREKFLEAAKRIQKHALQYKPPVTQNLWGAKATGPLQEYSTIRKQ